MISIPFLFENRSYYTLIRTCRKGDRMELRVTIMNGELEKILYGHHVFECRNGYLVADCPEEPTQLAALKLALLQAIDEYLQVHPLQMIERSG